MNRFIFILAVAFTLLPAIVEAADIRLKVKNSTLGSERKGDTRKSQRQLEIEIHKDYLKSKSKGLNFSKQTLEG